MSQKTRGAGAFASAAMLFAIFFAAEGSGANAQSELEIPVAAQAPLGDEQNPATSGQDEAIRFVSSEVVQEIPQDDALDDGGAAAAGDYASLQDLVAATSAEGELGRELKCLAEAVYFESRGEPLTGQLAVARVIINRSASPLFPDDYCSVVTQPSQFSFVRGGRIPAPNTGSDAWARATKIARVAHQDQWASAVGDSLYFHAEHVRPRWANRKTARATIDSHVFYR